MLNADGNKIVKVIDGSKENFDMEAVTAWADELIARQK